MDLIKRLREWETVYPDDYNKPAGHLYIEAADRIETLTAALKRLEYWFDTDAEILDAMTPDERAGHMRQLGLIREALTSGQSY